MPDASDQADDEEPIVASSELGAALREEWRAEQEEITRDAAEVWQHARTLLDVARDYMHRGDRVVVTAARHRASGVIIEVARDRIAVFDAVSDTRVDVQVADFVPLTMHVSERARAGGRSGARAESFRARLLELESSETAVAIATTHSGDRIIGTIAVGVDVVVVTGALGETVVPLTAIAAAAPAGW